MTDLVLPRIRTSDRNRWRRCRRLHSFEFSQHMNLAPTDKPPYFWFGTGMHFVLEDYHGLRRFESPNLAWNAYIEATSDSRPPEYQELQILGHDILSYYTGHWLPRRNQYRTLIVNGVPQVEVGWEIPILDGAAMAVGMFDRVVTDPLGNLWLMDYKFMAKIETTKLDNDPQVTAYMWAARELYGKAPMGQVYQQFLKQSPAPPRMLRSGKFSTAKDQGTTHGLYRQALMDQFSHVPQEYMDFLNWLGMQEDEDGDMLIRRTNVRRNTPTLDHEWWKIECETREMLDPAMVLYPNPTRDCGYCSFRAPCLAMDDNADYRTILRLNYASRDDDTAWRARIGYPAPPLVVAVAP